MDERVPAHTAMLLDRAFWLAKTVGALPSVPPPTPWLSPTPAKSRESLRGELEELAGVRLQGGTRRGGNAATNRGGGRGRTREGAGGRCAVCVVQKKGRCGTETAPARCLRRAGAVGAGGLGDPFDEVEDEAGGVLALGGGEAGTKRERRAYKDGGGAKGEVAAAGKNAPAARGRRRGRRGRRGRREPPLAPASAAVAPRTGRPAPVPFPRRPPRRSSR